MAIIGNLLAATGVIALHAQDSAAPMSTDAAVDAFRARPPSTSTSTTPGTDTDPPLDTTPAAPDPIDPIDAPASTSSPVGASGTPAAESTPADTAPAEGAQPPAAETTMARPAEGVYVYDTTGHERLDALGGARHDYPDETSITIRHEGCGLRERWQPLEERYDERQSCATATTHAVQWYESSRQFFGQTDTRRLTCDEGSTSFSADAPPGTEYRHRCVDPDTDARNVVTVLEDEPIVIDGERIMARRIRAVSDVTGDSRAHSEIDTWAHPDTGLTLRRVSVLDGTSQGPSGPVSYHEEYTLELRSLQPRR